MQKTDRAGVLPGDSSGADEGLLVEGEGGSEARLLQAGLASEGVDDGDVHLLQDLLEIAARLEGVLAPAGDPAPARARSRKVWWSREDFHACGKDISFFKLV